MRRHDFALAGSILAVLLLMSCAPARTFTSVPVPGWDYIEREFREPPPELPERDRSVFERGWSSLLAGDLASSAEALESLERRHRNSASVESALGYLDLRLGDRNRAESRFTAALELQPSLAPAQAGWALVAIAADREEEAFERLRMLESQHPEHPLVRDYLPNLQLKLAESKLQSARALREEKRYREAAELYGEAIRIAPAVAGLYTEAAEVELLSGDVKEAAAHAAKALELEPQNVRLYRLRGDALRAAGDLELAVDAYEKAHELDPEDASLAALVDEVQRELERESLPPQYLEIGDAEHVTREQLAALLFIRLRPFIEQAVKGSQIIATDIADSWAREFIRQVAGAHIMEVYSNHTFQPKALVRRGDLAVALAGVLDATPFGQELGRVPEPMIQDVSRENLNYRAVSLAVALGLLSTDDEGRFEPQRFVSGREAVDAVETLAKRIAP